jgi:NADPH:quinone reductase-like Zn-dependent oxidoreductase
MKAYTYQKYGSPEVLELKEVFKPTPKDNEIQIKVEAISLNPAEWHQLRGAIWLIRLSNGLLKPGKPVLGADIAGRVEAVGKKVRSFQVGDRVFGRNTEGGFAEFACLEENQAALIPEKVSYKTAAASPLATITALIGMRDKGNIQAGQKVLINGASGGIGSFAVQLAKYFGATVTGVCSGKNAKLVRSLGAGQVIDYTQTDFTKTNDRYDLVLDLIGNRKVSDINRVLKPEGRCVVIGYSGFRRMLNFMLEGTWRSLSSKKSFVLMDAVIKKEDLEFIGKLLEKGYLKPAIDKVFSFEEIPVAFNRLGTRRAKGKIIISLSQTNPYGTPQNQR